MTANERRARVAICDRVPSYRRGLGAALSAGGYAIEESDNLRAEDLVTAGVDTVLFTIRSTNDWQVLRDVVVAKPDLKVIALVVDASSDRYAEALRSGAKGVVAWEATPETILAVVAAMLDGMVLLPTSIAQAIAASGPPLRDPGWISAEEIEWLKLLARGVSVQQLAGMVGYSERALYRVLHGLYGRMRVSNRTEAILQASRWGLLEDRASSPEGPPTKPPPDPAA